MLLRFFREEGTTVETYPRIEECFNNLLQFDDCRQYLELIKDLAAASDRETRLSLEALILDEPILRERR